MSIIASLSNNSLSYTEILVKFCELNFSDVRYLLKIAVTSRTFTIEIILNCNSNAFVIAAEAAMAEVILLQPKTYL